MDNSKFKEITQIVVFVLLLVSVCLNVWFLTKENQYKVVEKVVTREVRDTIHDTVPEIRYQKLVAYRHDTLRIVEIVKEDTTSVIAEVPITQKEYSDDSTYRAWVSGYNPNLDSIDVFRKTVYVEKSVTKTKIQRFAIGPQVSYGYDLSNGKLCPTVGIGITYRMFGF